MGREAAGCLNTIEDEGSEVAEEEVSEDGMPVFHVG
jgi:hypothetical protein